MMDAMNHGDERDIILDDLDPNRSLRRAAKLFGVKLDTRSMRPPNPEAEAKAKAKRERRAERNLERANRERRAAREAGEL